METNRPTIPRVLVATTAMLSFISFWRAAAIVLNDLGSSAFYAGGIAEAAFGKAAPWFILAIMLFALTVRLVYMESCSMFVRGGVYRVVKAALGSNLAKFSVSALIFDYILTAPISGVAAGQYLARFLNELAARAGSSFYLPPDTVAVVFAVIVTLYFWRQNIKGIPESSRKALRIMQVVTVMVVIMIAWGAYTLWLRGAVLPPWPIPSNLHFSSEALGWLGSGGILGTLGFLGILVALGHAVLAMSGEETLAQVYREIEHPKLPNLKKTAIIITVYSLLFTALASFLAVMIIPDETRAHFLDNLIAGLAMNMAGPYLLRILFHAFVVVVGILMLSGAVNTAIVGANGVLNRVAEDGILSDWFRRPHPRFGTSHRIINLVVVLQLAVIILSHGNIFVLGEAYAFGVLWSFVMQVMAMFALRFKQPGPREYRVPLNIRIKGVEIPVGLGLIGLVLLSMAVANLFTKQVATISGITFTLFLFGVFTVSEKITRWRGAAHPEIDQFNVESPTSLSPQGVGCRPGNILVPVDISEPLYHLESVLDEINPEQQDVVVLHVRLLRRLPWGEQSLEPQQLFGRLEQQLFTKALALAEKRGKPIHLAVISADDLWGSILRAGQDLQSSAIVLGRSRKWSTAEQGRRIGLAWERLPQPRPHFNLEVEQPNGQRTFFVLGPHTPHLTATEVRLLHQLWLRLGEQVAPEEFHHHDAVHFALKEIMQELDRGKQNEVLQRLRQYLKENKEKK